MIALVDRSEIEQLVGADRHPTLHLVRMDTEEQMVFILHSQECLDRFDRRPDDLLACPFSKALDSEVDDDEWADYADKPAVVVTVKYDDGEPRLAPDLSRRS